MAVMIKLWDMMTTSEQDDIITEAFSIQFSTVNVDPANQVNMQTDKQGREKDFMKGKCISHDVKADF